jgi:hypothetical protein
LKVRERPTSTIRNVDGRPPGGAGCAARIRQLKLGYALDTYPIWIRIGYAVDTYPKSIRKKIEIILILGPIRIRPSWPITGYVMARWQPS